MKKNEIYDLSKPTRQSYVAIIIITYRLYRLLARQLVPLLILVLIQGKLKNSSWFIYLSVAVAILGAAYSIMAFFKYYFFIQDNKLVVKKGVFKKTTLEIPFDRIQSVNFEQNLIHRVFKVIKVNMDTAGSSGNELQLNALNADMAQQLSGHILKSKKSVNITSTEAAPEKQIIFRLKLGQLLKVGATENHIRSGGVILFFFFYIYDSLEEYGVDIVEKGEQYAPLAKQLTQSLLFILVFFILFSIVAFLISMIRTVLNFYDLQMFRKEGGFVIVSGLVNKKERAAKDEKIQIIKSSQNLLQKLTGIIELVMKQASSAAVSESRSIKVVGLNAAEILQAELYMLKSDLKESSAIEMKSVRPYYLFRRIYWWTIAFLSLSSIFYFLNKFGFILYVFVLYTLMVIGSVLAYKKKKYGISEHLLRLDGGIFGNNRQLIQNHKIQSIGISESFFQRRRSLCSVTVHTASGALTIPDIRRRDALFLNDLLLYRVEKSKRKWM
jgi:putative membrane protein